jgi:Trk K+ transport system NAD-binding subunit
VAELFFQTGAGKLLRYYNSPAMQPSRRRLGALLGALGMLLVVSAALYVARVPLAGVALIAEILVGALVLLAIPLYLLPELERRFQRRLPREIGRLRDGVLFFRDGPAIGPLAGELERSGLDPVVLETDQNAARHLVARGRRVVLASPGPSLFENLDLSGVGAIVANGGDDENAAMTVAARQAGYEGEILAIAEQSQHVKALTLAGANRVFAPRQVLAAALAARASERVNPRIVGAQALGRRLVVSEVKVASRSPFAGKSLRGDDIARRTGVTVVGQWRHGELQAPLEADSVIDPDVVLIVLGSNDNVMRFREACAAGAAQAGSPFVIAGCGEVGRTAAQMLRSAGETVVTVDLRRGDGVDVEGDVKNPRVLESSGVRDARAVVLAVGGDSRALLAALAIRDHAPDVPVLARVDHADNVELMRRAGADFALSVAQVAAQLVGARLLGHEALLIHPVLKVQKVGSSSLIGRHPAELGVRERTGVSVVAIERGDEVIVALDPGFTFEEGDGVYVCGDDGGIEKFVHTFPALAAVASRAMAAGGGAAV